MQAIMSHADRSQRVGILIPMTVALVFCQTLLSGEVEDVPHDSRSDFPIIQLANRPDGIYHGSDAPGMIFINEGFALTSGINDEVYNALGYVNIWDLRNETLKALIEVPARITDMVATADRKRVFVAGAPYNKHETEAFVCEIDPKAGKVLRRFDLRPVLPQDPRCEIRLKLDDARGFLHVRLNHSMQLDFGIDLGTGRVVRDPEAARVWKTEKAMESSLGGQVPNWLQNPVSLDEGLFLTGRGVLRTDTWERVMDLDLDQSETDSLVLSYLGRYLLIASRLGSARILDLGSLEEYDLGMETGPHRFSTEAPEAISFMRNLGENRYTVCRLELESMREYRTEPFVLGPAEGGWGEAGAHQEVLPSPDGRSWLIGTGVGMKLVTWSGEGFAVSSAPGHLSARPVGLSPDGKHVWIPVADESNDWFHHLVEHEMSSGRKLRAYRNIMEEPLGFAVYYVPGLGYPVVTASGRVQTTGGYPASVFFKDGAGFPSIQEGNGLPEQRLVTGMVALKDSKAGLIRTSSVTIDPDTLKNVHDFDRRVSGTGKPTIGRVLVRKEEGLHELLALHAGGSVSLIAEILTTRDSGWLIRTPLGWYAMSPRLAHAAHFLLPSGQPAPFEQWDPVFNRPDRVAAHLGGDAASVARLEKSVKERWRVLGYSAEPAYRAKSAIGITWLDEPKMLTRESRMDLSFKVSGLASRPMTCQVLSSGILVHHAPVTADSDTVSMTVSAPLRPGMNELLVRVFDPAGGDSNLKWHRVHRSGIGARVVSHVITIGVSDYEKDELDLRFAVKDAREIGKAWEEAFSKSGPVRRLHLEDGQLSQAGLEKIGNFLSETNPEDRVYLFIAAHGTLDGQSRWRLCPPGFDPEEVERTTIALSEVEQLFDHCSALARFVVIDACHAGAVGEGVLAGEQGGMKDLEGGVRRTEEIFANLDLGMGATVLAACRGSEEAFESDEKENGLLTHSLLEGMRMMRVASGDRSHRSRGFGGLADYASREVAILTEGMQRPVVRWHSRAMDADVIASKPDGENGFNEPPESFLRRFLFVSSLSENSSEQIGRLGTYFAEEVDYFGKRRGRDEIVRDMIDYWRRFSFINQNELVDGSLEVRQQSNEAVMTYQMKYTVSSGENLVDEKGVVVGTKTREGVLRMEMRVRHNGVQWEILSMKPMK